MKLFLLWFFIVAKSSWAIENGVPTSDYREVYRIENEHNGFCAATAISNGALLTGAHCLSNATTGGVKIVGTAWRSLAAVVQPGVVNNRPAKGARLLEKAEYARNEVAILIFKPNTFDFRAKLGIGSLATLSDLNVNDPVKLVGFGRDGVKKEGENVIHSRSYTTDMIHPDDLPRVRALDDKFFQIALMMRGDNKKRAYPEPGDSGGPLFRKIPKGDQVLVGILTLFDERPDPPQNLFKHAVYRRISGSESGQVIARAAEKYPEEMKEVEVEKEATLQQKAAVTKATPDGSFTLSLEEGTYDTYLRDGRLFGNGSITTKITKEYSDEQKAWIVSLATTNEYGTNITKFSFKRGEKRSEYRLNNEKRDLYMILELDTERSCYLTHSPFDNPNNRMKLTKRKGS